MSQSPLWLTNFTTPVVVALSAQEDVVVAVVEQELINYDIVNNTPLLLEYSCNTRKY